jgi:hypothetical protein
LWSSRDDAVYTLSMLMGALLGEFEIFGDLLPEDL